MDRLTASRVFVTVVERGSMVQAAEQLEMSTAMVSRHLAAMEQWLGARLLHRTTRRISLTEAGQAALASCQQLLDLAQDMEHQAAEVRRTPSGRLRLTASASFAEAQLAPALAAFQQQYPQVRFSLLANDRSLDLTAERIDVAVRITNALEPTQIARRLATCHSVLCAAPAYLARCGAPASAPDLADHTCLSHEGVGVTQFRFQHEGQWLELPVEEWLSTNDAAVLRRAVLAGAGLAVLPTYLIGDDLRAGTLVRVLPALQPEALGVHAVVLSRKHPPLALRLLIDFLAQRFGGPLAPWDRQDT